MSLCRPRAVQPPRWGSGRGRRGPCRSRIVTRAGEAPVGIFYATGTGSTKRIANSIKIHFGELADEPQPIGASNATDFQGYRALIFGAPSYLWEKHRVSALDFDTIEPSFNDFKDLTGVKVAIYGLGDQVEYPKNFCDAVGILWEHFSLRGAEMVGAVENEGYDFKRSRALKQGMFVGLPLDLENRGDSVGDQVETWVNQLKREFDL